MMKISYICQSYPPMISGAAIVVKQLAQGMVSSGHSVLVISASQDNQNSNTFENGINHVRLRSYNNPLRVGQKFVLWAYQDIQHHIQGFKPDVVHLHDPLWLGISGLSASRSLKIPVLLTIHQLPWGVSQYLPEFPGIRETVEKGLWAYSRWLLCQFDAVIAPSLTTAKSVCIHSQIQPEVISNGVNLAKFHSQMLSPTQDRDLREKYRLHPDHPIVLHVGRLDQEKQVDFILRAFAHIGNRIDAQLLVVGDGCQKQALINLIEELGIQNYCHFPGYVDADGDLPALYRIAKVFAMSSQVENQCLVLLEAIASGLPIVAIDATSIPELVKDGINGYLVNPGQTGRMADKLVKILSSPELALKMGKAGRSLANKHALEKSIQQHESLYRYIYSSKLWDPNTVSVKSKIKEN